MSGNETVERRRSDGSARSYSLDLYLSGKFRMKRSEMKAELVIRGQRAPTAWRWIGAIFGDVHYIRKCEMDSFFFLSKK